MSTIFTLLLYIGIAYITLNIILDSIGSLLIMFSPKVSKEFYKDKKYPMLITIAGVLKTISYIVVLYFLYLKLK